MLLNRALRAPGGPDADGGVTGDAAGDHLPEAATYLSLIHI